MGLDLVVVEAFRRWSGGDFKLVNERSDEEQDIETPESPSHRLNTDDYATLVCEPPPVRRNLIRGAASRSLEEVASILPHDTSAGAEENSEDERADGDEGNTEPWV